MPTKRINEEKCQKPKRNIRVSHVHLGRVTRKNEGMVVYHHMRRCWGLIEGRERRTELSEARRTAETMETSGSYHMKQPR